jgi:hypothetical protein
MVDWRGNSVAVAGLLLGAVVPFTLLVIMPTNRQLLNRPAAGLSETRALLNIGQELHAVHSVLGLTAFLACGEK